MLVDKIDFVEFDRQWRGLFEDDCDYELVVNGKAVAVNKSAKLINLEIVTNRLGRYSKSTAGVVLQHLHWLDSEVTLSFRKKPEPLPEGWQRNAAYVSEVVREIAYEGFSLRMRVEESRHAYYDFVYTPIVDFICPKGAYESVFRVFTYDEDKRGVLTSLRQGIQKAEFEAKQFIGQFVFWEV